MAGQHVTVQSGKEETEQLFEASHGKFEIADLVFLRLQLCLASDSGHMSQRDC